MHNKIRSNMFPHAHAAIEDWGRFSWHQHAGSPRSSQILAIDVFGTIKTSPCQDAILSALARDIGVSDVGPWQIHFEWQDTENTLAELTPTQIDVALIGAQAILLIECKFTEVGGGCSQIKRDKHGVIACDGSFREQTNPQNGAKARCALTGKGIKYWDYIPAIYGVDPATDQLPCRFASDAYQWMRNSVLTHTLSVRTGKTVRVVAAYADSPYLKTAVKVKEGILGLPTMSPDKKIIPKSYAAIIQVAARTEASDRWVDLDAWVRQKIERAIKTSPSEA